MPKRKSLATFFANDQGPVSRKSREHFGPEKPFVKLRPAYSVKLVFSYVVKGIKIKINAKFRSFSILNETHFISETVASMSGHFSEQLSLPLRRSQKWGFAH